MSALLDPYDPPRDGQEFLDRLRQRAFSCHERGELEAAESAYQRILERFPADYEVRRALGALAFQSGKYRWALQLFSQVAEFEDTADLQAQMGAAYCGLARLGDALRCYERAIAAQFDHLSARIQRAQVLHALGRREEAASAYARIIELGFDNAMVHTLRGLTLGDLGRTEESVACLERALALDPDYVPAHVNLGIQLRKLLHAAERAIALRPPDATEASPAQPAGAVVAVANDAHADLDVVRADLETQLHEQTAPALAVKPPSVRSRPRSHALQRPEWAALLIGAAPTAVTVVLAALVGSELARGAIALLDRQPPAAVADTTPAPVRAPPISFDVQPIVEAHLFGQFRPNQDPAAATPASAALKLTGTLATDDPRRGIAIIGETGKKSQVYAIGESLDGASLWQVYRDHVILERDGGFESLFLPRALSPNQALAAPHPAGVPGVLDAGPALDAHPGSPVGIPVVPGKNRARFMNSGLMGGDIVVAVNGTKLESDPSGDLWQHVASGSTVTVLRRGVRKDITLNNFP
jgi:type II secretory pathway component PulC/tetratricopeptide (TPR) repeat protein